MVGSETQNAQLRITLRRFSDAKILSLSCLVTVVGFLRYQFAPSPARWSSIERSDISELPYFQAEVIRCHARAVADLILCSSVNKKEIKNRHAGN
jgi:hypothetical protein